MSKKERPIKKEFIEQLGEFKTQLKKLQSTAYKFTSEVDLKISEMSFEDRRNTILEVQKLSNKVDSLLGFGEGSVFERLDTLTEQVKAMDFMNEITKPIIKISMDKQNSTDSVKVEPSDSDEPKDNTVNHIVTQQDSPLEPIQNGTVALDSNGQLEFVDDVHPVEFESKTLELPEPEPERAEGTQVDDTQAENTQAENTQVENMQVEKMQVEKNARHYTAVYRNNGIPYSMTIEDNSDGTCNILPGSYIVAEFKGKVSVESTTTHNKFVHNNKEKPVTFGKSTVYCVNEVIRRVKVGTAAALLCGYSAGTSMFTNDVTGEKYNNVRMKDLKSSDDIEDFVMGKLMDSMGQG